MGAALAALPIAGCGPSAPDPKVASAGPKDAIGNARPVANAPAGGPSPTVTAGPDAAPTPPPDNGAAAAKDPPADPVKEEPKSAFSRVVAKVGRNHGHVLTVAFADVLAGVERSYEMAGTSDHPHKVTLTADDMKNLLAGQAFRTRSTRDRQHAHRVLVRCAPPVDPPEWVSVCEATFSGQDEHEVAIPAGDMAAKVDKTYDVQGIAGHPHEITMTAADFQKLAKGEAVSVKTTRDKDDAHLHVVFIQYRAPKT